MADKKPNSGNDKGKEATWNNREADRGDKERDMNPQPLNPRLLDRYNALSEDEQRRVDRKCERHREACRRVDIRPDPQFAELMIIEAENGR